MLECFFMVHNSLNLSGFPMHGFRRVTDLAQFASALLRTTRHSLEYSTADMARVLDIPKTTYLRLERGRGVSRRSASVLLRAIEILRIVPRAIAIKKFTPALHLLASLTVSGPPADQLKQWAGLRETLEEIELNRAFQRNGNRALKSFQHQERLHEAWQDILSLAFEASLGSNHYQNVLIMLAKAQDKRPAARFVSPRRSSRRLAMLRRLNTPRVLTNLMVEFVCEQATPINSNGLVDPACGSGAFFRYYTRNKVYERKISSLP